MLKNSQKFNFGDFYIMGKVLSNELSCMLTGLFFFFKVIPPWRLE